MTVTIEIPKEIEAQLLSEAQASGVPISQFVRDFLLDHYEEMEDQQIAEARLRDPQVGKILAWTIEYDPRVQGDLRGIDKAVQKEILDYMETRISSADDPRSFGKALRYSKKGLWRYRVRDYRILCEIQEHRLVVLVVAVGRRDKIYD